MVYDLQKGGRWWGVYCAIDVQKYYDRVGFAKGGGNKRMMDSHNKALKENNLL